MCALKGCCQLRHFGTGRGRLLWCPLLSRSVGLCGGPGCFLQVLLVADRSAVHTECQSAQGRVRVVGVLRVAPAHDLQTMRLYCRNVLVGHLQGWSKKEDTNEARQDDTAAHWLTLYADLAAVLLIVECRPISGSDKI